MTKHKPIDRILDLILLAMGTVFVIALARAFWLTNL